MAESLDRLVADSDRAAAAEEIRKHYDSGRLTLDEFEHRLAEVHSARTRGDLEHAFRPLLPQRATREPATARSPVELPRSPIRAVNLVCILVWLFSGARGDFWPKWVLATALVMYLRRGRRTGRRGLSPTR